MMSVISYILPTLTFFVRSPWTGVKLHADDLFNTPLDQLEIDFENEGGETYICGNPPYKGSQWQTSGQKDDLKSISTVEHGPGARLTTFQAGS
jgi:hypothetical protein